MSWCELERPEGERAQKSALAIQTANTETAALEAPLVTKAGHTEGDQASPAELIIFRYNHLGTMSNDNSDSKYENLHEYRRARLGLQRTASATTAADALARQNADLTTAMPASREATLDAVLDAIRASQSSVRLYRGLLSRSVVQRAARYDLNCDRSMALNDIFGLYSTRIQILRVPGVEGLNALGLAFGTADANQLARSARICDFGRAGLRLLDVTSPLHRLEYLPRDVSGSAAVLAILGHSFEGAPRRVAISFARVGKTSRLWYTRLGPREVNLPKDHVVRFEGPLFLPEHWEVVTHWVVRT